MPRKPTIPSYRLHRQSGQGIVTLTDGLGNRRDVLLGKFNTPESRTEYLRVMNEWEAAGRRFPVTDNTTDLISVNELLLRFWRWAETHYRAADGTPSTELREYKPTLRPLREMYGHTLASEFGPLAL